MEGWFHGHGVFWRSDGMKFEGQFRGGRIWGFGMRSILEVIITDFKVKYDKNKVINDLQV